MNDTTKRVLKDVVVSVARNPVILWCAGLWTGATIMYIAAKEDLKNAKKASNSELELAMKLGELKGTVEAFEISAKSREELEEKHTKEVEALKAEIEKLKN